MAPGADGVEAASGCGKGANFARRMGGIEASTTTRKKCGYDFETASYTKPLIVPVPHLVAAMTPVAKA